MSRLHILCLNLLLLAFTSITITYPVTASSPSSTNYFNVLILNSYNQGHKWESHVMEGFLKAIQDETNLDINTKIEYLDFRNRADQTYLMSFEQLLEVKYPAGSIDAIYAVDDEAYNFILPEITNSRCAFYQVPLFFSGVDKPESLDPTVKPYTTGLYQRDVTYESLNLIFHLDSSIKQINIIAENSSYGDNLIEQVNHLIERYWQDEITIKLVQSDYIEDIEEGLSNLPPSSHTVNMLAGEFQYKTSTKYLDPIDTINTIKTHNPWPIFSNDQTYIHTGILGGTMDIGEKQGKEVFNMMQQVLKGNDIESVPPTFAPFPEWVLNYPSLYEYNINLANIPTICLFVNKKFYDLLVPTPIKCLIGSILLLSLLIITVAIYLHLKHLKLKKFQQDEFTKRVEREKLKTNFIVNMSHELRTPINIIINAITLLKSQINAPTDSLDKQGISLRLDNVKQNAYRLLKLSNNMIDITKLQSNILELNKLDWNIIEIIEDVFSGIVDFASQKNIEIIFDPKQEEIIIGVDKILLGRILLDLLSNAIKFTPNGGKIYGTVWEDIDNVIIQVTDTGIGIDTTHLNHIFDHFYQVDDLFTRLNEGSGIGLSLVKDMVELHNGKIKVYSVVGEGTTFTIYLPSIQVNSIPHPEFISSIHTLVNIEMSDVIK